MKMRFLKILEKTKFTDVKVVSSSAVEDNGVAELRQCLLQSVFIPKRHFIGN